MRRGVRVGLPSVRHHQEEAAQTSADGHHASARLFRDGDLGVCRDHGDFRPPTKARQVGQVCRSPPAATAVVPTSPTATAIPATTVPAPAPPSPAAAAAAAPPPTATATTATATVPPRADDAAPPDA